MEAADPALTGAALEIRSLSKTFGATRALRDVSFKVDRGHIHGLLGGNGSGKSSIIKILAGIIPGDHGGSIDLLGSRVDSAAITPEIARERGLRFVHQNPAVFQSMTLAENIAIGNCFPTALGKVRWKELRQRTQRLLDRFEIDARPDDEMAKLRQADQTMVAIARALQDDDENSVAALVLDEPTASLPDHEVEILLSALRRFAARGHTILYVSHRLDEVLQITDVVTILRDGRHVLTSLTPDMTESSLIEQIVGRPLERIFATHNTTSIQISSVGGPVLDVARLRGGPIVDVSFTVHSGEFLGIAGLLGSGRTELLQMLFGVCPIEGGEIRVGGARVAFQTPQDAMNCGIALVPESRERGGVFQGLSVRENLSIGQLAGYWKGWYFDHRRERAEARDSIRRFAIKTETESALISSLSGGNQQKVVLARWLRRGPRLLLLDEPTQGVDVGAREDVYASVRREVDRGMSVILVSSDFEELAQVCDRVVVLRNGRISDEVSGVRLDRQTLTELVLLRAPLPQEASSEQEHAMSNSSEVEPNRTVTSKTSIGWLDLLERGGLILLLGIVIVIFGILRPDTFATAANWRSIATSQPVLAVAALALIVPLIGGRFDISVGANLALCAIVTAAAMSYHHLPLGLAMALGVGTGAVIGLINGYIVAFLGVNSIIGTLGVATILGGIVNGYTGGIPISDKLSPLLTDISIQSVGGVPILFIIMVMVGAVTWFLLTHAVWPLSIRGRLKYRVGASYRDSGRMDRLEEFRHRRSVSGDRGHSSNWIAGQCWPISNRRHLYFASSRRCLPWSHDVESGSLFRAGNDHCAFFLGHHSKRLGAGRHPALGYGRF
jgi:ribose transport system ATP-binding protein